MPGRPTWSPATENTTPVLGSVVAGVGSVLLFLQAPKETANANSAAMIYIFFFMILIYLSFL
jgi:hypothetical protein